MEELDASVEKILRYKAQYCTDPTGTPERPEALAEAAALRQSTITLVQGSIPALGDMPFFCGCADYQAGLVSNRELEKPSFAEFMSGRLGGAALVTGEDPSAGEIQAAAEAARGHSAIFVSTYNGHLLPGQLALVKALGELNIPMAVVALRNPYDLRDLPSRIAGIAAWDYSLLTLDALVPILSGRAAPRGRMPIALERRA